MEDEALIGIESGARDKVGETTGAFTLVRSLDGGERISSSG